MIILGIETSCDETALSLIEAKETLKSGVKIFVLANNILSQIEIHKQYGGVFPSMAKREHSRNLIPLMEKTLKESGFGIFNNQFSISKQIRNSKSNPPIGGLNAKRYTLNAILEREPELLKQFLEFISTIQKPPIDLIAVTEGPGLEPCLWTGLNFAHALSFIWDIPVIPVNHMEGHIFSALLYKTAISNSSNYLISNKIPNPKSEILNTKRYTLHAPIFPAIALLISGGHTELVLIRDYFKYEIIGATRDDAVGEAFDKVARLLGLPYPGGPEISRYAEQARNKNTKPTQNFSLPRPMIHSNNLDFSFSGLKTAVLYLIKKLPAPLDEKTKTLIAREFEDAVTEVLIAKVKKALEQYNAKTLIIGGGVIANTNIRRAFDKIANTYSRKYLLKNQFLHIPEPQLTTDNALMITVAGYLRYIMKKTAQKRDLKANGNQRLDS